MVGVLLPHQHSAPCAGISSLTCSTWHLTPAVPSFWKAIELTVWKHRFALFSDRKEKLWYPFLGGIQCQVGWGPGQPDLVVGARSFFSQKPPLKNLSFLLFTVYRKYEGFCFVLLCLVGWFLFVCGFSFVFLPEQYGLEELYLTDHYYGRYWQEQVWGRTDKKSTHRMQEIFTSFPMKSPCHSAGSARSPRTLCMQNRERLWRDHWRITQPRQWLSTFVSHAWSGAEGYLKNCCCFHCQLH